MAETAFIAAVSFGAGGILMGAAWCFWYARQLRRFYDSGFDPEVWTR